MKKIMLLRHARSLENTFYKDTDRPLTEEGSIDADRMGQFLKVSDSIPNKILCSTAKRARETCEILSRPAGIPLTEVSWHDSLYEGTAQDYFSLIQDASDEDTTLLIVGHNPNLEHLVSLLCSRKGTVNASISQGGLICLEHPAIKWKQVLPGTVRLRWFVRPDLLSKF